MTSRKFDEGDASSEGRQNKTVALSESKPVSLCEISGQQQLAPSRMDRAAHALEDMAQAALAPSDHSVSFKEWRKRTLLKDESTSTKSSSKRYLQQRQAQYKKSLWERKQ